MSLRICAIIAARNEAAYLQVLLPILAAQRIDVAIVDNESTDSSQGLYDRMAGKPIITVSRLPFRGFFSLSEQLEAKHAVAGAIDHDWIVHHDADEIMEHCTPTCTLRNAIEEADALGHNVVNFDEFVFLPEPTADYSGRNYYSELCRYYFFEPMKNRLNRAWRRTASLDHRGSGGHRLRGQTSIHPVNHVLRHYIVLSQRHAREKYLGRAFDPLDHAAGWHFNRLKVTNEALTLPRTSEFLLELNSTSGVFSKARPTSLHYWQWPRAGII